MSAIFSITASADWNAGDRTKICPAAGGPHGTEATPSRCRCIGDDCRVRASSAEAFLRATGQLLSTSTLQVERFFLSIQTLHPAFRARTYLWRKRTDQVKVIEWPHGLTNRPEYYDSPDFRVHRSKTELRVQNPQNIQPPRCDPYQELKAQGYTDYLMVPLSFSEGTVNTLAIATKAPSGFAAEELDGFRALADMFTVIFERYAALETVGSALETYLGTAQAKRFSEGEFVPATANSQMLRCYWPTCVASRHIPPVWIQ
jgi:adenylate cyclase